jgi:hypothetical protein
MGINPCFRAKWMRKPQHPVAETLVQTPVFWIFQKGSMPSCCNLPEAETRIQVLETSKASLKQQNESLLAAVSAMERKGFLLTHFHTQHCPNPPGSHS